MLKELVIINNDGLYIDIYIHMNFQTIVAQPTHLDRIHSSHDNLENYKHQTYCTFKLQTSIAASS